MLIITDTLSSGIKDWIKSIENEYKFKTLLWEDLDIRRKINRNLTLISSRFPDLIKTNGVVEFKGSGKIYHCNEIEEVGFYIANDYGEEGNIKWIEEFIQYIKVNDVVFLRNQS